MQHQPTSTSNGPTPDDRLVFQLSDQTIGQVSTLVQLAILTGTDVVDHLRLMVLEPREEDDRLVPTPEYLRVFRDNVLRMEREAQALQEQGARTDSGS